MFAYRPLREVPLAAALLLCLSSAEPAFGQELLVGQAGSPTA